MSKRCCAKTCYNSQAQNKEVQYFGFPKNQHYSNLWAVAAGREDLLEKPLLRIIKYYICSVHFTEDCFSDPPNNKTLKRISRPFQVPVPTIFESNFDQVLAPINNKSQLQTYNHNNEMSNMFENPPENVKFQIISQKQIVPPNSAKIISILSHNEIQDDARFENNTINQDNNDDVNDSNSMINYVNNNEEIIFENNENENDEVEAILGDADDIDDFSHEDDTIECIIGEQQETIYNYLESCRLCANQYSSDYMLSFNGDTNCYGLVKKLFPNSTISIDDNYPQQSCKFCLQKVQQCLAIMESIENIQKKFYTKN